MSVDLQSWCLVIIEGALQFRAILNSSLTRSLTFLRVRPCWYPSAVNVYFLEVHLVRDWDDDVLQTFSTENFPLFFCDYIVDLLLDCISSWTRFPLLNFGATNISFFLTFPGFFLIWHFFLIYNPSLSVQKKQVISLFYHQSLPACCIPNTFIFFATILFNWALYPDCSFCFYQFHRF